MSPLVWCWGTPGFNYFQMVPSTIYPFYGRQYSQNVEKGEGEILKNIFTFNFNNQCHTGYGSHEFTSINVCTINNKCRFKGILARRFFICILFSSWHFQISFTPAINVTTLDEIDLFQINSIWPHCPTLLRVREAEKRKCMMIYSGYQAGESIWAMFHPYLTQVKYICPHTSGLVWSLIVEISKIWVREFGDFCGRAGP